jgi:hypothetical protein
MARKFVLLAMALGAVVALAVPAIASAQELRAEGEPLPVGSDLTATSTNLKTVTAVGTLECKKVTIHANVTENGAEASAAESTSIETEGCVTNQGGGVLIPTNIEEASANLSLNSAGGTAGATFVANIGPGALSCHFAGSPGITYTHGSSELTIAGELTGTGTECPPNGVMSGNFTLETAGGVPVVIQ